MSTYAVVSSSATSVLGLSTLRSVECLRILSLLGNTQCNYIIFSPNTVRYSVRLTCRSGLTRFVTRGAQGGKAPLENFSPWKNVLDIVYNYWTQFKTFGPSQKTLRPSWRLKLATGLGLTRSAVSIDIFQLGVGRNIDPLHNTALSWWSHSTEDLFNITFRACTNTACILRILRRFL